MAMKSNGAAVPTAIRSATNLMMSPLLADLYQFTMAYAYWKAGRHQERAVFDFYFRKSPFGGEYTIFAGLEECIRFITNFKFKDDDISFLRSVMPTCEALLGMSSSRSSQHSSHSQEPRFVDRRLKLRFQSTHLQTKFLSADEELD